MNTLCTRYPVSKCPRICYNEYDKKDGRNPSGIRKGISKMKKLLALTLALILVTSMAMAEIVYKGSSPIADEPITITVLTHGSGSKVTTISDMGWLNTCREKSGLNVEIEYLETTDALKARLAAGIDLGDIVKLPANDADMTWCNSGLFLDLTDLIEEYGFNIKKLMESEEYASVAGTLYTPDGELYFLPAFNPSGSMRCIMVNIPWLEQLDMKAPTNMDEFYEMLTAFKQNDLNGNGDASDEVPLFMRADMTQLFGIFWGLDLVSGWELNKEGELTCSYIQPEYYDFLQYFHKLYEEGLLYNEFATATLDVQNSLFASNQIGVIMHFVTNMTGYSSKINPGWDYYQDDPIMQVIIPPVGPYGDQVYYGNGLFNAGPIYGISANSKNPEAALCFLDYMLSDEANDTMWFGYEGTDYEITDGRRVFTDVYLQDKDGYRNNLGYNVRILPDIKSNEVIFSAEPEKSLAIINDALQYNKAPTLQFSYCLPDEAETVNMYKTDLTTYFKEMFTGFITGATELTEANFEQYVSNVKALHVDEVTAVYQAQYSRNNK